MLNNIKIFLIEYWYPKGRTDSDLAKAIGVDHSLISKWINGAVEPPLERKIQLAQTIGVDSRLLFPEESGNKSSARYSKLKYAKNP